jgi:hypothetical protein
METSDHEFLLELEKCWVDELLYGNSFHTVEYGKIKHISAKDILLEAGHLTTSAEEDVDVSEEG